MRSLHLRDAVRAAILILPVLIGTANADPFANPGDTSLRADLQLLNDAGVLDVPLTAWPLSFGDVALGLREAELAKPGSAVAAAIDRVRDRVRRESDAAVWRFDLGSSLAENPRVIRTFENTPRERAESFVRMNRLGERFAVDIQLTATVNPFDGEKIRPDGTYVGFALGNWILSAGWLERWWGPGNAGSLILSTNARPSPGIAVQRNDSKAFETEWLSWIGPWKLTSFMDWLGDEREITNTLLFGARFSFRPISGLEISLSRAAQWCGEGRPCDLKAFFNMLVGNDNGGINVDPEDEPGNQLAGMDLRWALPGQIPLAFYLQWIGEDGRNGTPLPGSWIRQVGAEVWGEIGDLPHKTFLELSDTTCHEGGLGEADLKPDSCYEHSIYRTGYRYQGRSIGHSIDGDGLSYSLGSTLVQSTGHSWNVLLRYMELNRVGAPNPRHTLSATPQDLTDLQISHDRITPIGTFKFGLGYSRWEDRAKTSTSDEASVFMQWSSR
jgi:hypothetical protein